MISLETCLDFINILKNVCTSPRVHSSSALAWSMWILPFFGTHIVRPSPSSPTVRSFPFSSLLNPITTHFVFFYALSRYITCVAKHSWFLHMKILRSLSAPHFIRPSALILSQVNKYSQYFLTKHGLQEKNANRRSKYETHNDN